MLNIKKFIDSVSAIYKAGAATEHSYRSSIEAIFHDLAYNIGALINPKRVIS